MITVESTLLTTKAFSNVARVLGPRLTSISRFTFATYTKCHTVLAFVQSLPNEQKATVKAVGPYERVQAVPEACRAGGWNEHESKRRKQSTSQTSRRDRCLWMWCIAASFGRCCAQVRISTTSDSATRAPGANDPIALDPALPAEEGEQAGDHRDHGGDHHPECTGRPFARELHVHPEDAREQGQRQEHGAEDRQHAEDVVLAVRDRRLVGRLQRLDDLLVVVEDVPDPLGGVDEVVEVELEVLGQEPLDVALEQAQRRALRLVILR